LTLEEIFFGGIKKVSIARKVIDDNYVEIMETTTLKVPIKKGILNHTRIIVQGQGDRHFGQLPANAVFIVQEIPHAIFKRNKFDISYTAKITYEETIGCQLTLSTLDRKEFQIEVSGIITPKTVKRIEGKGLPIPDKSDKCGDLLIHFDISSGNVF